MKSEEVIDAIPERSGLPALREQRSSVLLMPVMDVTTARNRLQEFQEFCSTYLSESQDGGNDGGDYGVIPGTKKKALLKSGADKLTEIYGLYDEYDINATIDWSQGLFDYEIKCILKSRKDDSVVGCGVGSCSSFESKYRWREAPRVCPTCKNPGSIIKGKAEYGGGWLCWNKKGGCGGKFKDGDKNIEGQAIGRIENPDVIDVKNTVLKMAKKRAKIDAVIGVTRSSGIFTQDMEDLSHAPIPPKPVEVSSEPVEIGKPKNREAGNKPHGAADSINVKGAATAPKPPDPPKLPEAPRADPPEESPVEFIGEGQVQNFCRAFRDALPKGRQKDAEDLRHTWLFDNGIVDILGKPSAKAIRVDQFYEVRDRAEKWASAQ